MPHNGGFALQFVTNLLITLGRWKNEIISTSYITSHTLKKNKKKNSRSPKRTAADTSASLLCGLSIFRVWLRRCKVRAWCTRFKQFWNLDSHVLLETYWTIHIGRQQQTTGGKQGEMNHGECNRFAKMKTRSTVTCLYWLVLMRSSFATGWSPDKT